MAQPEALARAQVLWQALHGAELPSLEALLRLPLLGAQGGGCVAALRAVQEDSASNPGGGAVCGVGELAAALVRALNALALCQDAPAASAAEGARQEVCGFALDVVRTARLSDDRCARPAPARTWHLGTHPPGVSNTRSLLPCPCPHSGWWTPAVGRWRTR